MSTLFSPKPPPQLWTERSSAQLHCRLSTPPRSKRTHYQFQMYNSTKYPPRRVGRITRRPLHRITQGTWTVPLSSPSGLYNTDRTAPCTIYMFQRGLLDVYPLPSQYCSLTERAWTQVHATMGSLGPAVWGPRDARAHAQRRSRVFPSPQNGPVLAQGAASQTQSNY